MILEDNKTAIDRKDLLKRLSDTVKLLSELFSSLTHVRKKFLLGKYDEKIQKTLKRVEPTTLLFGDNLKGLIESSKAIEKVESFSKTFGQLFKLEEFYDQKGGGSWESELRTESFYLQRISDSFQAEGIGEELRLPVAAPAEEPPLLDQEVSPVGARLRFYINNWKQITENPFVLNIVSGCKLHFQRVAFQLTDPPRPTPDSD